MINHKLRNKFDALAAKVADEGVSEGKQYHERTEALKAITAYYAAVTKARRPDDDGDADRAFPDFARSLEGPEPADDVQTARRRRGGRGAPQ